MTAEEFRSEMIVRVRAFDKWAYKDQLSSPADYEGYEFGDWFDLFDNFMKGQYND
jgi:hypothetical protein